MVLLKLAGKASITALIMSLATHTNVWCIRMVKRMVCSTYQDGEAYGL